MDRIQESKTILGIKNVSIGYKKGPIVENINLDLTCNEFVAIVGVNGIGKSTLIRTIGNMQTSLVGSISINGKNTETFRPSELASSVSLVLTEPIASKNLSVLELIALGRQPYTNWIGTLSEQDKFKIEDAVATLDLEELRHRKCFELSDGQLQRVMIARALAQDTPIILLDEPTTHLDLYHKVQILKILKSIAHDSGKTVVFTSHEIEMALQLCDKMLLLDGKTNPFGSPGELIERKAFESLFPEGSIYFDAATGSFRMEG